MKHILPQPEVVTIIAIIIVIAMLTSCGVSYPDCPNGGWQ